MGTARWLLLALSLALLLGCDDPKEFVERGRQAMESSDPTEAAKWFRKAAEQGYADGEFSLGTLYSRGQGVPLDYAEATKWLKKAAEQGHGMAQFSLGSLITGGDGSPQNYGDAVDMAKKAAEQGHSVIQSTLGSMTASGEPLPRGYEEIVWWAMKATDQGYAVVQSTLGSLPASPSSPSTKRPAGAERVTARPTGPKGDPDHQFRVGVGFAKGESRPRDLGEAARWYRKAAEQGHAHAQMNLGVLYLIGRGVPQDRAESYVWLSLAAAGGVEQAVRLRDDQARGLTPHALEAAQARARALHEGLLALGKTK